MQSFTEYEKEWIEKVKKMPTTPGNIFFINKELSEKQLPVLRTYS